MRGRHTTDLTRPHPGPTPAEGEPVPTTGGKSGAIRAAIFGLNDGLVSNLALIMGMAGAGVDRRVVLIAGIAGLLAGAFSMAAGEYISMRTQRELFERMIHLEAHELDADPEGETRELQQLMERRGIPAEAAAAAAEAVMADPEQAIDVHVREELGLDPDELGSPWIAAGSSLATFAVGAVVPIVPYLFAAGTVAAWTAVGASLSALFTAGAAMTLLTRRGWLYSGLRMVLVGGGAAAITFGIGRILGVTALG